MGRRTKKVPFKHIGPDEEEEDDDEIWEDEDDDHFDVPDADQDDDYNEDITICDTKKQTNARK